MKLTPFRHRFDTVKSCRNLLVINSLYFPSLFQCQSVKKKQKKYFEGEIVKNRSSKNRLLLPVPQGTDVEVVDIDTGLLAMYLVPLPIGFRLE